MCAASGTRPRSVSLPTTRWCHAPAVSHLQSSPAMAPDPAGMRTAVATSGSKSMRNALPAPRSPARVRPCVRAQSAVWPTGLAEHGDRLVHSAQRISTARAGTGRHVPTRRLPCPRSAPPTRTARRCAPALGRQRWPRRPRRRTRESCCVAALATSVAQAPAHTSADELHVRPRADQRLLVDELLPRAAPAHAGRRRHGAVHECADIDRVKAKLVHHGLHAAQEVVRPLDPLLVDVDVGRALTRIPSKGRRTCEAPAHARRRGGRSTGKQSRTSGWCWPAAQ
jgi:hypothetical protein